MRGEAANARLAVIASAAKQSILSLRGAMDCFAALAMTARAMDCFACHRARIRATRWLAMTERVTLPYPHGRRLILKT
jgi:hypothetical protein